MDQKIKNLTSTTLCGRRFTRSQLSEIQKTVKTFSALSRRELAHTVCEHLNWITPTGTDRIHTCLNALKEMEKRGIIVLPPKTERRKKSTQKKINWTDKTNESNPINCTLDQLMPLTLQIAIEKEQINLLNEFVDRYHYLGYKRPIGSHLRYYIIDRHGRKLGCLLFSFATWSLACRDQWIGWTNAQREKHLNLIINNNRFLIFPWVNVNNLASHTLSLITHQIADDWEMHHGYRPALLETFVDSKKYKGTCYKAANWQYIGKTTGHLSKKNPGNNDQKDVYVYPLTSNICASLTDEKKSPSKKAQPFKTANLPSDSYISLWQKIIIIVAKVSDEFDQEWQKRRRVISTLLIILFIFRLVFSKNKQGYGTTVAELWDYCHKMNIPLPQSKPVAPSAFCIARTKLDEDIFKKINAEVIRTYETDQGDYKFKNHRIFAVDGTKIHLPRQLLKSGYQTPSDNTYYPQGLCSCLYQLKSKIPVDFDLSSHHNERMMALNHLKVLNTDDIVIYDRGYFSYLMLYFHNEKGIHAVFRLPGNSFKVIDEFVASAYTDRIVTIMPSIKRQNTIRKQYPDVKCIPLLLRLIKYVVAGVTYTIGTTLIDNNQYPSSEFSDIYHARWGIEELYKISKVLIDVEDFHGQTERGVKQELFAHFVLITLSRIFTNHTDDVLMLNKKPNDARTMKANFKNCLTTVARNLEVLFLKQAQCVKKTIGAIVNLISTCRQTVRINRSCKRISKKPVKKWMAPKEKKNAQIPAVA